MEIYTSGATCQQGPGPQYAPATTGTDTPNFSGLQLPYWGYDFTAQGMYWYPAIAYADAPNGTRYYQVDRQADGQTPCWMHTLPSSSNIYAFQGDLASLPAITDWPTITPYPATATPAPTHTQVVYPAPPTDTPQPGTTPTLTPTPVIGGQAQTIGPTPFIIVVVIVGVLGVAAIGLYLHRRNG